MESSECRQQLENLIDSGLSFTEVVQAFAERRTDTESAYVTAALSSLLTSEGVLEVDQNAIVSESGDGGAYVMAWLWVDDPTTKET